MEQTVYGDILFFVNFCMDFQCLFLTAKLLHRPFPLLRAAIASAFGALYACAALFLSVSGVWAFAADLGVCLFMCALVFSPKKHKAAKASSVQEGEGPPTENADNTFARHSTNYIPVSVDSDERLHPHRKGSSLTRLFLPFVLYFGVSFAVGGAMSGMAALLSHVEMPMGASTAELSFGVFFLLAVVGGALTFFWGRFCQRRALGTRAELTLVMNGETRAFSCMVDTANLLRDPVGGRPVALIDECAAQGFLPPVLLNAAKERHAAAIAAMPTEIARRVRLIPANTATGQGTLLAIAPDTALLDAGRGEVAVDLLVAPVPLAVDRDDYTVLLPAALIVE